MTRRVLLIDADPAFRDTLTSELGPYQVAVVAEPDPERALQLATADPPALIVLCIEESDSKTGFRVFERCKKGPLASVPIMIVTGSISPDTFAKHRGLRNHADEYVDKRKLSSHELVSAIDKLIGLDDDLAIPIEDEIPMEIIEDDVAMDDARDHSEFDTSDEVRAKGERVLDSAVEQETDAAFAALFGGDSSDSLFSEAAPAAAPPAAPTASALRDDEDVSHNYDGDTIEHIEEAVASSAPTSGAPFADIEMVSQRDAGSQPEPSSVELQRLETIPGHDDPRRAEPPSARLPRIELPALTSPPHAARPRPRSNAPFAPVDLGLDQLAQDAASEQSGAHDRLAVRKIGALELEVARLKAELDRASAATALPGREAQFLNLREEMVAKDTELRQAKDTLAERDHDLAAAEDRLRQNQHARSALETKNAELEQRLLDEKAKTTQLSAATRTSAAQLAVAQQELEAITNAHGAAEAARAQLERDLAKERTTLAATTSEAEQLVQAERDQLLANFKAELAVAKADGHSAQLAAIAELREQLEQAHRATLSEMVEETRRVAAGQLQDALAAQNRAHMSEIVELQAGHARGQVALRAELGAEIARVEAALAAAHTAHRDTIATHDNSAASVQAQQRELLASHERLLSQAKADHDQDLAQVAAAHSDEIRELKATHASELAAYETELAQTKAAQQRAVTALQEQLATITATHHDTLSRVQSEHRDEVAAARLVVQDAVANAEAAHRAELADQSAQHAVAVEQAQRNHAAELERLEIAHVAALATSEDALKEARRNHAVELEQLRANYGGELDQLQSKYGAELERVRSGHAVELERVRSSYGTELEQSRSTHADETAQLRHDHAAALAQLQASHSAELDRLRGSHAAELSAREEAYEEMCDREVSAHEHEVAELRAELQRTVAALELKLDVAKRELLEHSANAERNVAALNEQHAVVLAHATESLEAKYKAEIAALRTELEQISQTARRSADAHRTALAETEAAHARALSQTAESARQEINEHRTAAEAAKKELGEALARMRTEREELLGSHAQALADQQNAAKIELTNALAARQTEVEKAYADTAAERDKLQQALTTARDSQMRSAAELATALQSIADRNAELRAHAAAIIERDQRIADLRKEIEAIENENASYQDQVLRAYQKIKTDEAMVARARKAMAIALTVLDDDSKPTAT